MALARSARAMKTRKEKTRIHNLPYGPGFVDYSGFEKVTGINQSQHAKSVSHIINTIQHNTIQYNTIQYNAMQYNAMQYNIIAQWVEKRKERNCVA